MNIYQALKQDHDELKPLLNRLVLASEHDQETKVLLDQIRDAMIPHSRAEEAVFYNPLRDIQGTKEVVNHGYREHVQAEALLRMLRGLEKINIEWTAAAKKLRDALFHHIEEEETQIFNHARGVLLDHEAEQMAAAFQQAKEKAQNQGDFKNTVDLIANMMPTRFAEKFRSYESTDRPPADRGM